MTEVMPLLTVCKHTARISCYVFFFCVDICLVISNSLFITVMYILAIEISLRLSRIKQTDKG